MENILLKKSFHAKNFKLLKFNSLWGYKGIFTTIRLFGKEPNFILVDQHLKKLNKDLRYFGIDVKISKNFLTNFLNKYSKIKFGLFPINLIVVNIPLYPHRELKVIVFKSLTRNDFFNKVFSIWG